MSCVFLSIHAMASPSVIPAHPSSRPSSPTIHCTQDSSHSLAVVNGEQSHMIHRTQASSQSLAVVNGEQSRKSKKFHRAFPNYDLLLCALAASSIYLHNSKCVAPPKSGEDAHITHGRCEFGGTTLNKPSLGFGYVLPRLWDSGRVRSPPNVPRDRSSTCRILGLTALNSLLQNVNWLVWEVVLSTE